MADGGVPWAEFEKADPDLARQIQARFESHCHAVMATIRADGSARLTGMEAPIRSGQLWLGMTPGSLKARDLAADGRFSLHSAPDSEALPLGDARIEGVVRPADADQTAQFVAGHRHTIEDHSLMVLYTALISRAVLVRVVGRMLVIESWTPADGHRVQSHE